MSIAFENVSFRYPGSGEAGIEAVDLAVADGELVAVIGPSGSGKSTLLKLLAGFLKPDRGQITVGGSDVSALPPHTRNLGIVFQSYALFSHMSVIDNVAYPLKVRGIPAVERIRRAGAVLESVGLGAFAGRSPRLLSGGQQQRVALARAIVFEPSALLLDEPLSALDTSLRAAMRDEIVRVQRAAGIAAIHVTHDQDDALSMADRIAVMRGGRIVQVATPHELYDHPCDAFVAGFVGEANLWPGHVVSATRIAVSFGALECLPTRHPAGSTVEVMVRPERITPVAAHERAAPNRFSGLIGRDRFLGAVRRFDLAVGDTIITAETASRAPVEAVTIPPEAIRLLPPAPNFTA